MSFNPVSPISADEAVQRLKAGNERFVAGTVRFPTVQKEIREGLKATGNATAAAAVGKAIAEKAKAAGITEVAFDRSGFKYHGRIKALADAARENGLKF